jgi:hypothetical protein
MSSRITLNSLAITLTLHGVDALRTLRRLFTQLPDPPAAAGRRDGETEDLAVFMIDHELQLCGILDRKIAGLAERPQPSFLIAG